MTRSRGSVGDTRAERLIFMASAGFMGTVFSLAVPVQVMLVFGLDPLFISGQEAHPVFDGILRALINLAALAIGMLLAVASRSYDRAVPEMVTLNFGIAAIAAAVRSLLQAAVGLSNSDTFVGTLIDAILCASGALVILLLSAVLVELKRTARHFEHERQLASSKAADALMALQEEELRVRRDVADALHGTMQNRLVLVQTELDAVAAGLTAEAAVDPALRLHLHAALKDLDSLREKELRQLSFALYPESLESGLVPAVRALLARVPATVAVQINAESFPHPDDLDLTTRLLFVRVAEEGVSNALRHGKAQEISIELHQRKEEVCIRIRHIGETPGIESHWSGLARLRKRLAAVGGELDLRAEPDGAKLTARLLFERP